MRSLSAVLFAAVLLSACSGSIVPAPRNAESYMQEGERFLSDNRYDDAIASWEKVRERYVSPEMNALADLKIAEAYYLSGRYIEAATAYEAFLKQYPEHEQTNEALYRLGVSYHKEMLAPERDQTTTRNAISAFTNLLRRAPDTPQKDEIAAMLAEEKDHLAGHELHIGSYYLKKEAYAAALTRLEPIEKIYPDFSGRDQLLFALGSAYLRSNERSKAAAAFNRLYTDFPQSPYVKEARKLLEKEF